MKVMSIVLKVLAALAAAAGVVYVIATYGDKIVAWAKNLLGMCQCDECEGCECNCDGECTCECECDECDCCNCGCDEECECECEEAEEEVVEEVSEDAPAAEEADFEG